MHELQGLTILYLYSSERNDTFPHAEMQFIVVELHCTYIKDVATTQPKTFGIDSSPRCLQAGINIRIDSYSIAMCVCVAE